MIRCVLCGNSAAGKTSLLVALHGHSPKNTEATIGAAFMRYKTLDLWDTAGQEMYRALLPMYFRCAQVVLVVFDLTDPSSFAATRQWTSDARETARTDAAFVLVGTKSDLPRAVSREEAEERAGALRAQYWETSAVTDRPGVQALFDHLRNTVTPDPAPAGLQLQMTTPRRHWSCCT